MRRTGVLIAVIVGIGLISAGLARVAAEEQASHQNTMKGHHQMMAHHHMMAFCPFMTPGAEIKVTPTKTGATIEVTATDPTAIARIQKKAQILQLMHELRALGPERPHDSHEKSADDDEEQEPATES